MKHLFVPYEIALALKEKGFNEPCFGTYHSNGKLSFGLLQHPNNNSEIDTKEGTYIGERGAYAPIYQQVVDWFREKHKIYIAVNPANGIMIFNRRSEDKWPYKGTDTKETYYQALNQAIIEALKLI